jgi:hypothetical protein
LSHSYENYDIYYNNARRIYRCYKYLFRKHPAPFWRDEIFKSSPRRALGD